MNKARRYVIVGSGAAGLAAAEAVRVHDPSGSISMLTDDPHGYYSRPGLAYYLANEIPQNQIFPWPRRHFQDLKIDLQFAPAIGLLPEQHQVQLKNNQTLPYDRLLIATGATAALPDLPGLDLKGVVKLDSLDDALNINDLARRGRTAVVVGGGITALELVEGMAVRGLKVHYFLRGDRYWSNVLDEVESHLVEDRLKADGVTIHYFTNLVEIQGRHGQLTGVRAKSGEKIIDLPCHILGIAIGIRPRKELPENGQLKTQRGVLVDQFLRSSDADIFAAGDVAQVFDPLSGEYTLDSLWGPAIEMGQIAGMNMTGCNNIYTKLIPFNVTRIAGLVTTIIGQVGIEESKTSRPKKSGDGADTRGIMRGESEIWRQVPDAAVAQTYEGENRVRLYFNTNRLIGSVIIGDQTLSVPIQEIIRKRMDMQALRPQMLEPGAPLAELIQAFWKEKGRPYVKKIA